MPYNDPVGVKAMLRIRMLLELLAVRIVPTVVNEPFVGSMIRNEELAPYSSPEVGSMSRPGL